MPVTLIFILIIWISMIILVVFNSIKKIKHINKLSDARKKDATIIKAPSMDKVYPIKNFTTFNEFETIPLISHQYLSSVKEPADYHKLIRLLILLKFKSDTKLDFGKIIKSNSIFENGLSYNKTIKYNTDYKTVREGNTSLHHQMLNN